MADDTAHEEARRALSGLADEPVSLSSHQTFTQTTSLDPAEKKLAEQQLAQTGSPLPSPRVAPIVPPAETAPLPHTIISEPEQTSKIIPEIKNEIKIPEQPPAPVPKAPLKESYREPIPEIVPMQKTISQKPLRAPQASNIVINDPTPPRAPAKTLSLADLALSQEEARRTQEQETFLKKQDAHIPRSYIIGGAIIVFILGGALALYFALAGNTPKPIISIQDPQVSTQQFIIKPDISYALPLGANVANIKTQIAEVLSKQNKTDGAIGAFVITTEDAKKKQIPVLPADLLRALYPQIPASLAQSLGTNYMTGRFAGDNANSLFFVLGIDSYEDAFAGLQNWYPEEAVLFAQILKNNSALSSQNLEWKNVFIKNIDARILTNSDDDIFIAYTFLTKKLLLISADKESFLALVEGYTTPQKTAP